MLDLMGDYVATAQIAGYFLLCFGDFTFLAFVNSLFALIYREVMQHMRVQELDFALRTARSLSPTAFGLLRRSSARTVERRERLRQKYKCSYEGIFNKTCSSAHLARSADYKYLTTHHPLRSRIAILNFVYLHFVYKYISS